jgi:hypothetical protein
MVTPLVTRRRGRICRSHPGGRTPGGEHCRLRRIPEGALDADILEPRRNDERRKLLRIHEAEGARILQLENACRVVQEVAGDGPRSAWSSSGRSPPAFPACSSARLST